MRPALYPDTGEWRNVRHQLSDSSIAQTLWLITTVLLLQDPSGHVPDSESGEAYEAEVEAAHENRDPEALMVLPSSSIGGIQLSKGRALP